jgi:exonuclease SbcC
VRVQRVKVHNFKCFKDAELNFKDFQAMTVIGSNGSGKSTLVIDALTWCIYGRTSLTDLRGYKQDDLVRVGARDCYAEVEFELAGDIYAVRRAYSLAKKNTSLDIYFNKKHMNFKIKDAEYFLSEHIGLDYEGFVNSSIIRQEEMKKLISEDPSKRKDIFISLFRLGIYEDALDRSKRERGEEEKRLAEIKASQSTMEALLSQEADWEKRQKEIVPKLKQTEQGKVEVERALHAAGEVLPRLEEATKSLAIKEARLDEIRRRITIERDRIRDNTSKLPELEEKIKECMGKAKEADTLRSNYETMVNIKEEYSRVSHEKEMIEQLIRIRLEQELNEISKLEKERNSLFLETQSITKQTSEELRALDTATLVNRHRESIDQLEKSARNLGKAESAVGIGKAMGYDKERIVELESTESESKIILRSSREVVENTLNNIVTELPKLSATETKLENIKEEISEVTTKVAEKQRALKEESLTIGEISGRGSMSLKSARIVVSDYVLKLEQLANSGYTPDALDVLKREVDESASAKEESIESKEKVAAINSTVEFLTSECSILDDESIKLEQEVKSLHPLKEEYQKAKDNVSTIQYRYSELKADLEGLRKQRDEIELNLKRIESYRATARDLKEKQKELEQNISDYRSLEAVFHRDGIPSAILKRIIPRVASEASSILAELTERRYDAITIEEQEDGKLNIWVKDGDEKYGVHRFSGGEKVRIALAVRLAVSKVLSELPEVGRRLSRMKTLIIDEGDLGSLDGEGLNSTMAIINDLTKLFGLTVLISHLDAVKGWVGGNFVIIHRGDLEKGSTIEYA